MSVVAPQAASAAITPAKGVQIKAAHSKMCLNLDHDRKDDGAPVLQYTCSDSFPNDKWLVRPVGTANEYQIVSASSGKCLHTKNAASANDTPIVQWTCVDTAPQNLWQFVPVPGRPTFRIVTRNGGKCLNVSRGGMQATAALIIYTCTQSALNDQFYFPPAASPDSVPVATVPRSPLVAAQGGPEAGASVGPLVYSWTDAEGVMWRGYQQDPDNTGTVQWGPTSGLEQFAGHPQINVQADGRVVTAARNTADGDLWLTSQSVAGQAPFAASVDVGGAGAQQPALGRLPDGKLVAFAVVGGALWHLPQDGRNAPYAAWRLVGGSNLAGEPTAVTIRDGLRLFALDTSGRVQTALYRDGALGDWTTLGAEAFTGRIAATVLPGYRTRVVVRDADGRIHTKVERIDGTFDPEWTPVGDLVTAGPPAVVRDRLTGVVTVVARGGDDRVQVTQETEQASGVFGPWAEAHERAVRTDPTIVAYTRSGGPAWGYVVLDPNNAPFLYRRDSGGLAAARSAAKSAAAAPAEFVEHALPRPPKR